MKLTAHRKGKETEVGGAEIRGQRREVGGKG
jgi:hypothetical protein